MIEARGAEVCFLAAFMGRLMDGLAELDALAEMLGAYAACVQPELPPAVMQVLDVDAAGVAGLDHRISPAWYPVLPRPWIVPRPPRGS